MAGGNWYYGWTVKRLLIPFFVDIFRGYSLSSGCTKLESCPRTVAVERCIFNRRRIRTYGRINCEHLWFEFYWIHPFEINISQQSGFSDWLTDQLIGLSGIPAWVVCLIVTVIICLFTECTSNMATASLFIPIISQLVSITHDSCKQHITFKILIMIWPSKFR